MELVCKKKFEDEVGATFTLNKKYKFQFESGFGYYTIDDNKKFYLWIRMWYLSILHLYPIKAFKRLGGEIMIKILLISWTIVLSVVFAMWIAYCNNHK